MKRYCERGRCAESAEVRTVRSGSSSTPVEASIILEIHGVVDRKIKAVKNRGLRMLVHLRARLLNSEREEARYDRSESISWRKIRVA